MLLIDTLGGKNKKRKEKIGYKKVANIVQSIGTSNKDIKKDS